PDALGDQQTITLGPGAYNLTMQGSGETAGATGDLNIHGVDLSIVGAGAGQTIINASQLGDRAFHVAEGATLAISGVTIENGNSTQVGGTQGSLFSQGIDATR